MKRIITAWTTAAVLAMASAQTLAATSDNQTSAKNGKLSCDITLTEQDGKILVSWTITGATSASIDPLTFDGGKVPLKGSQAVDKSANLHVSLIAKDADGNTVRCHAGMGKSTSPADVATGTTGSGPVNVPG